MANQESRLAIVIDTSSAEKQAKKLERILNSLSKKGESASNSISKLTGTQKTLGSITAGTASKTKKLDKSLDSVSKAGRRASKSTDKLSKSQQKLGDISDSASAKTQGLSKSFSLLKTAALGFIASIGASTIFNITDSMQSLDSQVRLVTNSVEEFNAVQRQLRDIANTQYTSISSLTELYTRSRRALEQLGKTQQQTLDFTNNIAMAMRVGGATAQEQSAALLQLSQALASGVLRGEEFNSIAEQSPILLRLIAQELGVAQGKLRELAADGKITSEIVYNAISNATDELTGMAEQMPVTIGQALTVLKNNLNTFVGDFLNTTTGMTGVVAGALMVVAQNFDSVINIATGGAVAWGAYALSLGNVGKALSSLATLIMGHPILALAGVIATIIVAINGWEKSIQSLGDAIGVVGTLLYDFTTSVIGWIKSIASTFSGWVNSFIEGSVFGVNESAGAFGWLFSTTEGGFLGLLQVIANVFDGAARVIGTFAVTVGKGIYNLGVSIGNNAKGMANVLIRAFNWAGNAIANILNGIINKANSAIKLINKIPGVNVGTIEARVKFKQVGEFNAAPKLDNSIKGNWESVGNAVKLYGARSKLDKAIYKYTYNKLKKENASADLDKMSGSVEALGNALEDAGKKGKKAGGKTKKAAKEAKDELTDAQKAAEKLAEAFNKAMASLDKSIASIGITTEFEKWSLDLKDATNELSKLDEASKNLLLAKAVELDITQASNEFKKQNLELRNQIELLGVKDDYQKELLKIQQGHNQLLSQYNVLLDSGYEGAYNKIVAEANVTKELREQLALTQARKSANDAFYNLTDSMQEDSPMGKLIAEFEQRKEIIQAAKEFEIGTAQERTDALLAIEQSFMDKKRDLLLTQSQDLFSGLSGLAKSFAGEQSGIYRALFAIEKGFAIAQSAIAIQQSIAKAMAVGFPQNIPLIGQAIAQGGQIMSAIKSISAPVGQAHDGIMSVPKSGTWNLEKGERVLPQHTAKALDKKLAKGDGSKVIINNYSNEKAEARQDMDGNTIVTIGKMINNVVDAKISNWEQNAYRPGGTLYNLVSA